MWSRPSVVDMAAVRLHTYCSEQTNDDEGLYEGLGVSHYRFMIDATQSRNSQGGEDGKGNGLALRTLGGRRGLQERRALRGPERRDIGSNGPMADGPWCDR